MVSPSPFRRQRKLNVLAGDRSDMFRWNGSASIGIPEHDSVGSHLFSANTRTMTYGCRITQENKLGSRFIEASDFLKNGIPASIIATFVRDIIPSFDYC